MKETEFLDGISYIDPDVVERFVSMDNRLRENVGTFKSKQIWLRVGAIAACAALIISAIVVVPMLTEPKDPIVNPPNHEVPPISTIIGWGKITGKQELVYGTDDSDQSGSGEGGMAETEMISPGLIGRGFEVHELYAPTGERIEATPHPSMIYWCRVPFEVKEGDIMRAASGKGLEKRAKDRLKTCE
jgi:hypothetical protein